MIVLFWSNDIFYINCQMSLWNDLFNLSIEMNTYECLKELMKVACDISI